MLAQKNNKRNKDQCKNDNLLHVSHFVGLSGVGGVQRNFVEYINSKVVLESNGDFLHKVYTLGNVDPQYKLKVEVFDIRKLINLLSLILDIVSKDKIVHLYNNLASTKLAILLFLLPVSNLILHERGTVWNLSSSSKLLLSFVVWKANLVLANSKATKTILEKKFYIDNKKIKVLHNGIDTTIDCGNKSAHQSNFFQIGFIGRLDTPKGVHVLIDAMQYLKDKGINLKIAGTGVLECILM
jgi:glycosyltransferase involved in cell wall biosynthesis